MKQTYPGYDFYLKSAGKKYYSNAKEVKRFCFEKWKEGITQREIGELLGLSASTVCCHITSFCKDETRKIKRKTPSSRKLKAGL